MCYSYPIEILPYSLRARGHALSQTCSFIAIFFNTFVNPIALEAIGWKYYFVFLVVCAVQIVNIYFTFPEVKGRTLEEIAEVFDGQTETAEGLDRIDALDMDGKAQDEMIETKK